MTKRISAKHKIDRRLGENLWGAPRARSTSANTDRPARPAPPRQDFRFRHTAQGQAEVKGYYGNITERQFRRIYDEATRLRGDTSENLIALLERRLDAAVYRAKFVSTPFAARQFVSHGHVRSTAGA